MGATPEQNRRYRAKRIAKGLCGQCGKRPPEQPDRTNCNECLARGRKWKQKNIEQRRSTERARIRRLRLEVLGAYGTVCACCGESEEAFLAIDHINGGGHSHVHSLTVTFYSWLRNNNYPPGFQTLCHNCNWGKHVYGECPHRWRSLDGKESGKVAPTPETVNLTEASHLE